MKKRRAFLLCGFSNWGKTKLIRELFQSHKEKKFWPNRTYTSDLLNNKRFAVLSVSNDDESLSKYIRERLASRIVTSLRADVDLIAAFCHTKIGKDNSEAAGKNNSLKIIKHLQSLGFEVHILLLIYKWDTHAALLPENIQEYYRGHHIKYHTITSIKLGTKLAEIVSILNSFKAS
jgi:hypothetical protein